MMKANPWPVKQLDLLVIIQNQLLLCNMFIYVLLSLVIYSESRELKNMLEEHHWWTSCNRVQLKEQENDDNNNYDHNEHQW